MNQLTTTPVQPLTLCYMPRGERPIDIAIWYFSDANGDIWAAQSLLGLVARTYNNRSRAIAAAEYHEYHFRIFGGYTPAGHKIVAYPAEKSERVTCAKCALCQKADRDYLIGFRAHGTRKKLVSRIALQEI